ncbi:translation initiation factor IF-2 subunit beta [Candidatus Woesearchaeota archaeon]|nr:translation initiation factor IF-2 subunit beta [Candidatus Woesearchaeota archaeon]
MDYKKLLEKARKELPEDLKKSERFKVPAVKGHIEGNKTVINNFGQIANVLGRDKSHLLKFVLKELAAPGDLKNNTLIIKRRINSELVNEKIQKYAKEFVTCTECDKPDTKIVKKGNVTYLKCLACGASHPIREIIK